MNIDFIPSILQAVTNCEWKWTKADVRKQIAAFGWKFVERVLHREEYLLHDDIQASIYFDGEECLLIEIVLDWFVDVAALDAITLEDKIDEYYQKYQAAVQIAKRILGKAIFDNGAGAHGFPSDQEAVWLALWKFGSFRLMIQQKHEDRESPFRVCIVIPPL